MIRYPYRKGRKPRKGRKARKDRQEQLLLLLLTIGGLLLPLVYIFTHWLAFADYNPPAWVVVAGVPVMAVGLWLFWRSQVDLGDNWSDSLDIHEDHALVTQGVYRLVRYPMESAAWITMVAHALILSNWIAGFSGLVCYAFLYFLRVPREEQMMLDRFGEQYRRTTATTGRVMPRSG